MANSGAYADAVAQADRKYSAIDMLLAKNPGRVRAALPEGMRAVSVLTPGVLGTTGVETAEIVAGVPGLMKARRGADGGLVEPVPALFVAVTVKV